MRKLLLLLTLATCATAFAASNPPVADGYYRIRNYYTDRYAFVLDNKGSINYQASTADLGAIELYKTHARATSNPASVMHVVNYSGVQYNINTQGTSINDIISTYVRIMAGKYGCFYAYGSKSGMTKYLCDGEFVLTKEVGYLSEKGTGEERLWYFDAIDATDDDNYFGVQATEETSQGYYATMYADFPFTPYSTGVSVWTVTMVDPDFGAAVIEEVKGVVPANTPVLFKLTSDSPSDNRLDIGGSSSANPTNLLKGVYFNFDDGNSATGGTKGKHYNRTDYQASTMRVLGVTADGSIGFVTDSSRQWIDANTAYLPVSSGTPSELKIMTKEEYITGITTVDADLSTGAPFDVYNTMGVKVRSQVNSLEGLPAGIYIANGKKYIVR
ncbi:MAG: hypothetical protein LIO90_05560 [Bacteroidales bacterium]|nr:hypothetical protein [Bacteroidales bacterium]